MTSIWKRDGGGVLEFVICLRVKLFLSNRSIAIFAGGGVFGGQKIGLFVDDVN